MDLILTALTDYLLFMSIIKEYGVQSVQTQEFTSSLTRAQKNKIWEILQHYDTVNKLTIEEKKKRLLRKIQQKKEVNAKKKLLKIAATLDSNRRRSVQKAHKRTV